ncbi:MAG: 4Fe-4S binding protein [Deferrisomatales bacterium]
MSTRPQEFYTPKVLDDQMTGMIKTREAGTYSARLRIPAGIVTADVLEALAEASRRFGRGEVYLTARLGMEIPGVSGEEFAALRQVLADAGVGLAGCGPRMRSTVACKGTVCPHGNVDTFDLAWEIDLRFNDAEVLPHKFKVAVAGCASTCSKPETNDVGLVGVCEPRLDAAACVGCGVCVEACHVGAVEMKGDRPVFDRQACVRCGDCSKACPAGALPPARTGVDLYVGGRWGRHKQVGICLARFLTPREAVAAVGRVKAWYAEHGRKKERLGQTLCRMGVEAAQAAILEDVERSKWAAVTAEALARFQPLR